MIFYKRTQPPEELNPCYTYLPQDCIKIDNSALPNCIGYVIARVIELTGQQYGLVGVNGTDFYDYNRNKLESGVKPRLGAIACWKGHEAIVEDYSDKIIEISQSHYNGVRWDSESIGIGQPYHGMEFQGFLYLPIKWDNEHITNPFPTELTGTNYYRVRKSWADVRSQIGAYHNLNYAMAAAVNAGHDYHVYDPEGKEVPYWN